jgi:hypothetical protein
MPLNASEKGQIAQAFLKCFGEDSYYCGRTLRFVSQFTNANVNILADVQNAALTWQPFIEKGLDIPAWNAEVARIFNLTGQL